MLGEFVACEMPCEATVFSVHDTVVTPLTTHTVIGPAYSAIDLSHCPVWGRGTPLPPCPFTSSSFPLFTFSFLSLALSIFFFCPSLPFLPE